MGPPDDHGRAALVVLQLPVRSGGENTGSASTAKPCDAKGAAAVVTREPPSDPPTMMSPGRLADPGSVANTAPGSGFAAIVTTSGKAGISRRRLVAAGASLA